jgi:hypothetical protein
MAALLSSIYEQLPDGTPSAMYLPVATESGSNPQSRWAKDCV